MRRDAQPAQHDALVILVRHAEAAAQARLVGVLSEKPSTAA